MLTDTYRSSLDQLKALGPMRVWSVLVTVFGDLAPDHPIPGPTLSKIMTEIGIKPEATRVALHRLRADGWITTQRVGRHSEHSLSLKARADSAAARPQIYGGPPDQSDVVFFLLPPGGTAPTDGAATQVAQRLYVTTQAGAVPREALGLKADDLAPWVGAAIETAALKAGYADSLAVFTQIDTALTRRAMKNPLQRAALRVLIVHAWRRLALKHALLPVAAHSAKWQGHKARAVVTTLLVRFDKPSLDDINTV